MFAAIESEMRKKLAKNYEKSTKPHISSLLINSSRSDIDHSMQNFKLYNISKNWNRDFCFNRVMERFRKFFEKDLINGSGQNYESAM